MNVPKGTPVIVATVNPVNMMEIALALRFSGTKSAAIVAPIDMKTPCENADRIRANSNTLRLVAAAAILFPIINMTMIQIKTDFLGNLEVKLVRIGAPIITPTAYKEIVNPASETEISKS